MPNQPTLNKIILSYPVLMSIFDKKPKERRSPTIGEDERKREMEEVKAKQMGCGISPRKEVINSMGQHGRNDSWQVHGHNKK